MTSEGWTMDEFDGDIDVDECSRTEFWFLSQLGQIEQCDFV